MRLTDSRARKGTIIKNKVTGAKMVITGVTTEKSLMAVEIDPETSLPVEGATPQEITEESSICFRILCDPNPEDIPQGYDVEEGVLMKDGNPATEQGELFVKRVYAALPGYLVLGVKPREGEGVDLFIYEPGRDKFTKIVRATLPELTVLTSTDNGTGILLGYSVTKNVDEKQEDGTMVTKTVFETAGIIKVHDKRALGSAIHRPISLQVLAQVGPYAVLEAAGHIDSPVDDTYLFDDDEDEECGYDCDEESVLYVTPLEKCEYVVINVDMVFVKDYKVFDEPLVNVSITPNVGLIYKTNNIVVIETGDEIKTSLVAQLDGYDYLVDKSVSDYETIYTFANASYKVKRLSKLSTKDRGVVYKFV